MCRDGRGWNWDCDGVSCDLRPKREGLDRVGLQGVESFTVVVDDSTRSTLGTSVELGEGGVHVR